MVKSEDWECERCGSSKPQSRTCLCLEGQISLIKAYGDHKYWALGADRYFSDVPSSGGHVRYQAQNLQFLKENTTIPIPKIVETRVTPSDRTLTIYENMKGENLEDAWPELSQDERESIAKQIAEYLGQLQQLQSSRMEGVGGLPAYHSMLQKDGWWIPRGPHSSHEELSNEITKGMPKKIKSALQERMPLATPFTFSPGIFRTEDVSVKDGKVVSLLSWEHAGYYPVWWHSVLTRIVWSEADHALKILLAKYVPQHKEGNKFFGIFRRISEYIGEDEYSPVFLDALAKLGVPEDFDDTEEDSGSEYFPDSDEDSD